MIPTALKCTVLSTFILLAISGLIIFTLIKKIYKIADERDRYRRSSENDSLTGILNNAATRHAVTEYLTCNESLNSPLLSGALFIIDIDNFKNLNDTFGHPCGDILLAEIARTLRSIFRSGDIVGRIGGDEFAVFMKNKDNNCYNRIAAEAKAGEICRILRSIKIPENENYSVSCSIGIAVTSHVMSDFDSLYEKADIALYKAKTGMKNTFVMYT